MAYYIDLTKISIDQYKNILRSADILPSWMILKEDIDKNLETIKQNEISNMQELTESLKNKSKVIDFAKHSGLSEEYLTVLRRVINGYRPKPNKIKDFPDIPADVTVKLETLGIKNTLQLYPEILTPRSRDQLAQKSGIDKEMIIKLAKLSDLSRVRWVNHTFAHVLLLTGYNKAQEIAEADYSKMYERVKELNKKMKIYKGNIGEHDMKLCVDAAQGLDFEIQWDDQ